jgi:hypothetical protein
MDDEMAKKHGVAHKHGLSASDLVSTLEAAGLEGIAVEEGIKLDLWFAEKDIIQLPPGKDLSQLQSREENGTTRFLWTFPLVFAVGTKR